MKETTLIEDNSTLTIHYNDKDVRIDPKQKLSIKWTNGKNGIKSTESKKAKYLNIDLPSVSYHHVEPLPKAFMSRPFKMPSSHIQSATEEEEQNDGNTEYDLDREDLAWLHLANVQRRKKGLPPIDEGILENSIDMLEKESHFQFTKDEQGCGLGYLTMIDNDAPCCICNDGEDSNANQIIFCDICNIAVHQECYGVPYIPEGQWLCRRCQMSPSLPVNCCLCPCTSGAFKQTSDGRWVHVVCAIWLNEVHFANTVFLEPVEGVDFSIKRRHKLKCLICKRKGGACLQCSNKACVRSFHATCARYAGMKMVVKESRARNNADSISINRFAYCFQHSNPNRNGQSIAVWKREMEAKIKTARKMIDFNTKQTLKFVPMPVIPMEKVQTIAQQLGLNYVNDIYSYWSLKRKSRSGVPLIRRLQVYMNQQKPLVGGPFGNESAVPVVGGANNELVTKVSPEANASTSVEQAKTATRKVSTVDDPSKCFAGLRRNFERARLLCELIKKREKMKHDQLTTSRAIVCKTMRPLAVLISQTLAKLIEKDHQKMFAGPILGKNVSNNSITIPKLMDFQQMRANLEKGRYKRINDLRADFLLLVQNWTIFNKNNTHLYNYGQRIKRIGLSAIKVAEIEEQRMDEYSNVNARFAELSTLTLNNEAVQNLCNEFKWHNKEMAENIEKDMPENGKITMSSCSLDYEANNQQEHSTNNNQLKKMDMTSSSSVSASGKAASFEGKKIGAVAKKLTHLGVNAKRGSSSGCFTTTNTLSEQKKNDTDDDNGNKKEAHQRGNASGSGRLKRSHSTAKTSRTVEKGTTQTTHIPMHDTVANQQLNSNDNEQHQITSAKKGKSVSRGGGNSNNNLEMGEQSAKIEGAHVHGQQRKRHCGSESIGRSTGNGKKSIVSQRMSAPILPQKRKNAPVAIVCCNKNIVRKKNYVNAYQTEGSSAAESDSGQFDELLFVSLPEQNNAGDDDDDYELPSTVVDLDVNVAPKLTQRRHIRSLRSKKYLKTEDEDFVPPSPTTNSFRHNDIVMVAESTFPGRVIDIRMRAIDIEDEEEDDDDLVNGRRTNAIGAQPTDSNKRCGVGRNFIDYALRTKPTQEEMSRQQHTLVLFFDNQNTCKWIPNDRIRLLYENDLNIKTLRTDKDQTVVEAFEKAKRFWKGFIHC